jgi:hypothetical protein
MPDTPLLVLLLCLMKSVKELFLFNRLNTIFRSEASAKVQQISICSKYFEGKFSKITFFFISAHYKTSFYVMTDHKLTIYNINVRVYII